MAWENEKEVQEAYKEEEHLRRVLKAMQEFSAQEKRDFLGREAQESCTVWQMVRASVRIKNSIHLEGRGPEDGSPLPNAGEAQALPQRE